MLPSPEMLKYKILVKNKKRKEDMPDQMEKDDEKKEEEAAPLSGTGKFTSARYVTCCYGDVKFSCCHGDAANCHGKVACVSLTLCEGF